MELSEFLAARLDDDEHTAKMAAEDASAGAHWHVEAHYQHSGHAGIKGENGEVIIYDEGSPTDCEARHIARHDPARVLAEVAAGRARIALYREAAAEAERFPHGANVMVRDALYRVLQRDAVVHSGHADYDPAWAPGGATQAAPKSRPAVIRVPVLPAPSLAPPDHDHEHGPGGGEHGHGSGHGNA